MKRRLREGAKLIVDRSARASTSCATPHVKADYHLQLRPGTNVALINALAHVIVTEGLHRTKHYVAERCERASFEQVAATSSRDRTQFARSDGSRSPACPRELVRGAARLYATGRQRRDLLRPRRHRAQPGLDDGDGHREPRDGDRQHRPRRRRRESAARPEQRAGLVRHGLVPARVAAATGTFRDAATRALFEEAWGVHAASRSRACASRTCSKPRSTAASRASTARARTSRSPIRTRSTSPRALAAMECIVVQDLFLNETAKYAHVFLPGSSFLEKDGTFTNAERRISRVRKVMQPRAGYADWEVTMLLSNALGYPMNYTHPSRDHGRDRAPDADLPRRVATRSSIELGSIQWPCNDDAPEGTPTMHVGEFVRGKGKFLVTEVRADDREGQRASSRCCSRRAASCRSTTSARRRGARRTSRWHDEDRLEIHPHDAEDRGIKTATGSASQAAPGETVLRAMITERMQPGVVYTTFHFPESGANVITTENSDWATNCPEYKVTAVQVMPVEQPSEWQKDYSRFNAQQLGLLEMRTEDRRARHDLGEIGRKMDAGQPDRHGEPHRRFFRFAAGPARSGRQRRRSHSPLLGAAHAARDPQRAR